jgi:hypothetical protein
LLLIFGLKILGRENLSRVLAVETYLGARVDCGADVKTVGLIKEHSVKQVALPCAVHAGHCNDSNGSVQLLKEVACLLINFKLYHQREQSNH